MRLAEEGLRFLASTVDTLIVIPNQNLFQMVDKQTSLLDSFRSAVVVGAVAVAAVSAVVAWLCFGFDSTSSSPEPSPWRQSLRVCLGC